MVRLLVIWSLLLNEEKGRRLYSCFLEFVLSEKKELRAIGERDREKRKRQL